MKKPNPPPGYYIREGRKTKCHYCKEKKLEFIKYHDLEICKECWRKIGK